MGGVSTKTLNTGCTLVEFPVGTDLKTVMSQASFIVDGSPVDASSIIPNPATLSLKDAVRYFSLQRKGLWVQVL